MNAILIDTSATVCSAALVENDKIIKHFRTDEGMRHAVDLPQFIEQAMAIVRDRNITLDVVAVSSGPGSYTGLRIGVSTAKGLCYATGARLIAVSTLRLMALELISKGSLADGAGVMPMIDARRMEVYTQRFSSLGVPTSEPEAKILDEGSFADITTPLVLCGNGAAKCAALINNNVTIVPDIVALANDNMLLLATEAFDAQRFEDVAYYEPFYLKEFYTN